MTSLALLELTVPGDPTPKARPRIGRAGRAYTPASTTSAEQDIGLLARAQLRSRPPVDVPVAVELAFFVKTSRRVDVDNLAKLVLDALNGIAWIDDDQVVSLTATKTLAPGAARTHIRVHTVDPTTKETA